MDAINEASPAEISPAQMEKPKSRWIIGIPVLIALIAVAAIVVYLRINVKGQKQKPTITQEPQNAVFNLKDATFAQYNEVKSTVTPAIEPYTLKSSNLINLKAVVSDAKIQFSANQLNALEKNGFFTMATHPVVSDPNAILDMRGPRGGQRSDDMVDLYSQFGGSTENWQRKSENAIFVTSDFLLHTYHVLIDRTFQKTEEVNFQPALKSLTESLYTDAISHYSQEQNPKLKDSWKRLSVFYLVPKVILETVLNKPKDYFGGHETDEKMLDDQNADSLANIQTQLQTYKNSIPPEVYELASQELELVMKAEKFGVPSPLYGTLDPDKPEDYTQYNPRSHYTRNSILRSYFRSMMWYGRHGFGVNNLDLTRDALLMTWQLGSDKVNGKTALELWQGIYLPTVFFVGRSDDLTIYEYSDLMTKIYGNSISYSSLADETKLTQFQTEAKKLPGPKILSDIKIIDPNNPPTKDELLKSTKGFRFMGQRFIPDSYMFSTLTQGAEKPDPETNQSLPSTPTALMIMSILGSNTADSLLSEWISMNALNSDKVIAKVKNQLKKEFDGYDQKTWTQNIYWSWLYNLSPLFDDFTSGYPMFMKNLAWGKKSVLSALGSWTELRHDTLLYAKQSYAEMGGGTGDPTPTPPPVPKGYVEPNLSFLTRLIALTTMTRDGLDSRGLLVPGQKEKFDSYLDSLQFFKSMAEKEVSNSPISDDEYEKLRTVISSFYPNIVWVPDGDQMTEQDARSGIIADVHTDALKGQILYEATGAPSVIYVAVKDRNGTRLTRGVTYSYYEFTQPVGKRLTDQDWQSMIYEGKNTENMPQPPIWANE